jgi:hypothetical protein
MTPRLKLSDRAFRLRAIFEALGGTASLSELMRATGKSQATIYRTCSELADTGYPVAITPEPRPPLPPPPPKRRRYCFTEPKQEAR